MISNKRIKKIAAGVALTATPLLSGTAMAYETFTIQEGAVPGAVVNEVVADQINGSYVETISANLQVGVPTAFTTSGIFNFSGYTDNANNPVPSQLLGVAPGGYNLYALFQFDGVANVNALGGISFSATVGSASVWVDPNQDSVGVQDATGALAPTVSGNGDDVLLGTVNDLIAGEGSGALGIANGDFEIIFDNFGLTGAGESFFIDPSPFYLVIDINGNFQEFDPAPGIGEFTSEVTGAGQVFFAVPEPSIVALFGIGLLGLGFGNRRRKV